MINWEINNYAQSSKPRMSEKWYFELQFLEMIIFF